MTGKSKIQWTDATNRRAQPASGLADDARKIAESLRPLAGLRGTRFMTDGCKNDFRVDAADIRRARAILPLAESLPGRIEALEVEIKSICEREAETVKTSFALQDRVEAVESQLAARDAEIDAVRREFSDAPDPADMRLLTMGTGLLREQLAARDAEIARLAEELRQIERIAKMSASIMRDNDRTNGWESSERVARQFDRLAERAARRHDNYDLASLPENLPMTEDARDKEER